VEIPPGGEIPHVTLEEASATNRVKTFGARLSLTRQDFINDDLSMFATVPGSLGRLGALALEKSVYVALLANAGSFFHADNKNLLSGADSALSLTGIQKAVAAFAEQTDLNGDPTLLTPAVLLTSSGMNGTARELMNSETIVAGTALIDGGVNVAQPASNPWQGLATPIHSPFLGIALGIAGSSDTAWYLLVGPGDFSVVDVAFLDGIQSPTIESGDVDFAHLGMQFRSYFDFGVALHEHRGGVKSAGS
jgi:hypothetical protein